MEKCVYHVRIWKKGSQKSHYEDIVLTKGENYWLRFYELMKKYKCDRFRADSGYLPCNLPSWFRWCYFN